LATWLLGLDWNEAIAAANEKRRCDEWNNFYRPLGVYINEDIDLISI